MNGSSAPGDAVGPPGPPRCSLTRLGPRRSSAASARPGVGFAAAERGAGAPSTPEMWQREHCKQQGGGGRRALARCWGGKVPAGCPPVTVPVTVPGRPQSRANGVQEAAAELPSGRGEDAGGRAAERGPRRRRPVPAPLRRGAESSGGPYGAAGTGLPLPSHGGRAAPSRCSAAGTAAARARLSPGRAPPLRRPPRGGCAPGLRPPPPVRSRAGPPFPIGPSAVPPEPVPSPERGTGGGGGRGESPAARPSLPLPQPQPRGGGRAPGSTAGAAGPAPHGWPRQPGESPAAPPRGSTHPVRAAEPIATWKV